MKLFLLLVIVLQSIILPQEYFSIHKDDYLKYKDTEPKPSFFDPEGKNIIPLQTSKDLTHRIFGYLPAWEYPTARHTIDYTLLTHIGLFDFSVDNNGNMSNPSYWPWTDVINDAHTNGVKAILTAVNFNGNQIRNIMTNPTAKQNFFTNVKNRLIQYQLDGVNVDFEDLLVGDRGDVVNNFMMDLKNYLAVEVPGAEVSFAAPPINWSGWKFDGLAAACDYIFIMGYAFWGSWSSTTGPGSPLTGWTYNITNTVTNQFAIVPQNQKHKLILGVPYYGLRWKTQTANPQSSTISYIGSTRFRNDYFDVQTHGLLWHSTSQTPWYRYQQNNEWYQVWFDNDSSLGLKYQLATDNGFGGVGMWALGYDGSLPQLWDELRRRFFFEVPVELFSFSVTEEVNGVLLQWSTATELNNAGFEIERNGIITGFVKGKGTTSEVSNYSFRDERIGSGELDYNLYQIDYDGTRTKIASEIITVSPTEFVLHQNYPNPFNPSTIIRYNLPESGNVSLKMFNPLGEEVAILINSEWKEAGSYNYQFSVTDNILTSGVYFYRLQFNGLTDTKKMVLIR